MLHEIVDRHYQEFIAQCEQKYRETYGDYRFDRIERVIGQFRECGDFTKGIARIRCTNPECGHDYFRPFSCKSFYLCPSCHQKRTLLFAEHLTEQVLLDLPHCQFVFSIPKALRVFFRYDQRLFADVSRLIYRMIIDFYTEAAGRPITGAAILAFQSYGDFLRWNSHWHALVLEGGFDSEGTFYYLPYRNLEQMTEYFRRKLIGLFLEKELINEEFAANLLSWKHSGFSIDDSAKCFDTESQASLAEYISRPPISLDKLRYDPMHGRILWHTKYNQYFGQNVKMMDGAEFIRELVQHIPPKRIQLIRRYGLYSSRGKGRWSEMEYVAERAPQAWKGAHGVQHEVPPCESIPESQTVDQAAVKSARARLLVKVYEIHPFVCEKCGSDMRVIAIIQDQAEITKILRHLVKLGRAPPGVDPASLN